MSGTEISCREVRQEIADFIDGILDPTLRWRIEQHLGECERCTAMLDGVRKVVALAADARMFDPPMGFGARLKRALARNSTLTDRVDDRFQAFPPARTQ